MEGLLVGTQVNDSATNKPQALHGRRDSYRRLARRAVRQRDSSSRHLTVDARLPIRRPARTRAGMAVPVPVALPVPAPLAAAASTIQIRCFGRFELSGSGGTVQHWRRRSAERLLKFLLVNGRRVHRDVLMDMLWPEVPSGSSIGGLRVTLHALRRAVAQVVALEKAPLELIRAEGDTYVLDTSGVWIDSDVFEELYSAGLRYERSHQVEAAVRSFAAAEALYRDDFLIEDLYEEWTVLPREELKDKYLLVLTKLAEFSLASMDLDGCIRRSHALLAKEPCREDAYQRLMQCYARLGQRGSAVRWYQICERTLREELDVTPSEETRGLYREISRA